MINYTRNTANKFSELGLLRPLVKRISDLGFVDPYPIQTSAIPVVLEGKDVFGVAKTGSGKTAGYALPIVQMESERRSLQDRCISSLILVPTRELAIQVEEVFRSVCDVFEKPVIIKAVYGGVSINPQMKNMSGTQVLIATPGRLLELIEKKALSIDQVRSLVLDEADRMLGMGFSDEVDEVLKQLPSTRQTLLFSATISDELTELNKGVLRDPQIIKLAVEGINLDHITQVAYQIDPDKKGVMLRHLIQSEDWDQVLVFVASTKRADNLTKKLKKNGIDALAIHSGKSQGGRTESLRRFKAKQLHVLVATDLLSRGIDIEELPVVINYELPRSPKDYVHRIGRTGRADKTGKAISFIDPESEHHFKIIQKKMKVQVEFTEMPEL